jgi:hypothetical protein
MNERLTIRNWHFEIFTWLPIGRCDVGHGSGHGRWRGAMGNMKGDVGATPDNCGNRFFSPQARRSKEDARSSALAEKDLTFYVNRFL